jgi:hypothetical protein
MEEVVEDSKTGAKAITCMDEFFLFFKNVGVDGNVADNLEFCCVVVTLAMISGRIFKRSSLKGTTC